MSLRFRFSFRGAAPIEIAPAELAESSLSIRRLRAHLHAAAGAAREALADQALAGLLARCVRAYGEDYLGRVTSALDRIYRARTDISGELDRVMQGELPDFARVRHGFDEIDLAFPEVIDPASSHPPAVSPEIARAGGVAVPAPATIGEVLGQIPDAADGLSSTVRTLLDRANEADSVALRRLLTAEDAGTLRPSTAPPGPTPRAYDALVEAVRGRGFNQADTEALLEAIRGLNEAWRGREDFTPPRFRATVDATIDALATSGLPQVSRLQAALRASARLRALLMADSEALRLYWSRYASRSRLYGFGLYVWFNMHHARGAFGEWSAAFELGRGGIFVFLKGPKAEVTTGGTDLVALDVNTGDVLVIDNKATGTRGRIISAVSALMRNFPQNLLDDVRAFRAAAGDSPSPALESVLHRLERAETRIRALVDRLPSDPETRKSMLDTNAVITLTDGERVGVQTAITDILQEHGITRVVTDAGSPGFVSRLSSALEAAGLEVEQLADILPEP